MNEIGLTVEFKIKNTGIIAGKAVLMMFLTFPDSKEIIHHIFLKVLKKLKFNLVKQRE